MQAKNSSSYENLIKTLELSESIYHQYLRANLEEKSENIKIGGFELHLGQRKYLPKYRKPFDIIAKGLSPLNWLPIVDEFRNFLMSEEADIVLRQIEDFQHSHL